MVQGSSEGEVSKLATLVLRAANPQRQTDFYRQVLGMSSQGPGCVGYGGPEMAICFMPGDTAYAPKPSDRYWKIAIAVPNIELAYDQLRASGVAVSVPEQFLDVGYLAHAYDPEGFCIEIIEHSFKGQRQAAQEALGSGTAAQTNLLGGGPHLNLLSLRTSDIAPLQGQLIEAGMKPLSVQDVKPYGFTLYFFGFTDEAPPKAQLEALENRTWLYRRRYTVLEIQHQPNLGPATHPTNRAAGYVGLELSQCPLTIHIPELAIRSVG